MAREPAVTARTIRVAKVGDLAAVNAQENRKKDVVSISLHEQLCHGFLDRPSLIARVCLTTPSLFPATPSQEELKNQGPLPGPHCRVHSQCCTIRGQFKRSVFLSFIIKISQCFSFTHGCFFEVKSAFIFFDSQKAYAIDSLPKYQYQIILLLFKNVIHLSGALLSRLAKTFLGLFFIWHVYQCFSTAS